METPGSAHLREELRARDLEVENLQAALVNSRVIGAAVGVLMERDGLTYDDAFAMLCQTSQHLNVKVREIADQLLYSGALPAEHAHHGSITA
jgi:AmiR/NasT family two-component response regulator